VILLGLLRIAQNGAGSCAANGNFAVRLCQLSFAHELFRSEIRVEIRDNVTDRVPFEVVLAMIVQRTGKGIDGVLYSSDDKDISECDANLSGLMGLH